MSLFVCTGCQAVENTALSNFWSQSYENRNTARKDQRLCSECLTGKWHGRFPKRTYDGSQTVQWVDGQWINPPPGATGSILREGGDDRG